jgi:hypothetical protein
MAGPLTQRFAQDISWIVSHNVVQFAQPRPWFLVIYVYNKDDTELAQPYAMISKNEPRQPQDYVRVRVWEGTFEQWGDVQPLFSSFQKAAEFLTKYHLRGPDPDICLASSEVFTAYPIVLPVRRGTLRHRATPVSWLCESYLFQDFHEEYHELHGNWHELCDAENDISAMEEYVQRADVWEVLFEDQLLFLMTIMA